MNRIEQLRKERGLSQQALADRFNVHQTAVSQWEKERIRPSFDMVMSLSAFFNVNANYLMGSTDKRTPFNQHDDDYEDPYAPTTPQGWLCLAFSRSNEAGQKLILDMAQAISGNPAYAADYPGSPANRFSTPTE